jgi:hypothetical protein
MKKAILLILTKTIIFSCLFAQTIENPYSKLGYDKKVMYTSSKGDYEEFHDNRDVVEIGTVYFNTKTNKVVGFVKEEKEIKEVISATPAMSVDPLCDKYYWITPYSYCLNNPIRYTDPDGRAVRPVNTESFNVLLLSLPAEARSMITMNNSGFIDASSVNAAYSKFGNSGNIQALRDIVLDERIVDFNATANTYDYVNASTGEDGTFVFREPIRRNVYQEMLSEFTGTPQEKQQYAQHLISVGILDKLDVSGNFGAMLRPSNAQYPYPGGQISKSDNFQVFVNPIGTTPTEKAKNVGHELFGHLYFWFKGKDPRHETPTSNPALNRQIIDREKESEINSQY